MSLLHPKQENTYAEFFGLTDEDKELIAKLTDPIPFNEEKRITVLRQTKLLDTDGAEPTFDRFTSLGQRLFGVSYEPSLWICVLLSTSAL